MTERTWKCLVCGRSTVVYQPVVGVYHRCGQKATGGRVAGLVSFVEAEA